MKEHQTPSPDNNHRSEEAILQKKQRELEEKAALLQHITDNMFDLVAMTDPQGNFTFLGKSHEILGYDLEMLIGKNVMDFVHPEDYEDVTEAFMNFLQNREDGRRIEYRIRCQDGSYIWLETMGKILTDGADEIKELLFSSRDITHQKREEEQLKTMIHSTQRLLEVTADMAPQAIAEDMRSLTGAAYVALNQFDDNGRDFTTLALAGASDHLMKAANMIGFNPVGKEWPHDPDRLAKMQRSTLTTFESLSDLTGEALPARLVRQLEKSFDIGQSVIINIKKNEKLMGDFTLILSRSKKLENPELATLYATQVGMYLERLNNLRKLKDERQRLTDIIEATHVGTFEYNMQTGKTAYNERWAEMLGYTLAELQPTSINNWKNLVHPEDHQKARPIFREATAKGAMHTVEVRMKHKEGHWVWVEARGKVISWTDEGKPLMMRGTHTDITERKQAEEALKLAKQQAEAANEAKSRYLSHMNHEMRTPLNGLMGFIQLVEETRLDEEQRELMDYMKHSANHMLSIVNNVLDHAKIEAGEIELGRQLFLLEEEIKAALAPLYPLALQKNLIMQLTLAENLPQKVLGDPQRLRQILLNLGGNAVKFTEEGWVHITLTCPKSSQDHHILHLVVEDTGAGMTEGTLKKLFKPFYQADDGTVRQTKGTGLGLVITRELVELMGGRIQVDSTLGKGTRVEVALMLENEQDVHCRPSKE